MTLTNFRFKKYTKDQNWKSTDDHATTIVSKNSKVGDDPSNNLPFKAHPLKNSYRRGFIISENVVASSKPTLFDAMEKPGGTMVNQDCNNCKGSMMVTYTGDKTNLSNNPQCTNTITDHAKTAIKKTHHPTLMETKLDANGKKIKYFTRLEEYRKYKKCSLTQQMDTSKAEVICKCSNNGTTGIEMATSIATSSCTTKCNLVKKKKVLSSVSCGDRILQCRHYKR